MRRARRDRGALPGSIGEALQKRILEVLDGIHRPMSAYDMLSAIVRIEGKPIYPNQIYGALDRLIGANRVERVESLSGYMLRRGLPGIVLICRCCGMVTQIEAGLAHDALRAAAERRGFSTGRLITEAFGHCAECVGAAGAKDVARNAEKSSGNSPASARR